MKLCISNHDKRVTMLEAIRYCSLDTEEILANLLIHLVSKNIVNADQLAEMLYWDFTVEEVKE